MGDIVAETAPSSDWTPRSVDVHNVFEGFPLSDFFRWTSRSGLAVNVLTKDLSDL
jgi:hypothetical protein